MDLTTPRQYRSRRAEARQMFNGRKKTRSRMTGDKFQIVQPIIIGLFIVGVCAVVILAINYL